VAALFADGLPSHVVSKCSHALKSDSIDRDTGIFLKGKGLLMVSRESTLSASSIIWYSMKNYLRGKELEAISQAATGFVEEKNIRTTDGVLV
jgi:hypothetical protein